MRSVKYYVGEMSDTFLSCEKDTELIIKKLFVDSKPYSDELKRLLLINTKDCLDDRTNPVYKEKIANTSIADLIEQKYVRLEPQIKMGENQETKSYISIAFYEFTQTTNDQFRDCVIEINIICPIEQWNLGNFRQRPIKIMGYIDGLLNKTRLTGIGRLEFVGAGRVVESEELAGYCLLYRAVHGDDDSIEPDDE